MDPTDHFLCGLVAITKYGDIVGVREVRQHKRGTDLDIGHTHHGIPEYPVNREAEQCRRQRSPLTDSCQNLERFGLGVTCSYPRFLLAIVHLDQSQQLGGKGGSVDKVKHSVIPKSMADFFSIQFNVNWSCSGASAPGTMLEAKRHNNEMLSKY